MAKTNKVFALDDTATFDENLVAFGSELARIDGRLGPVLQTGLKELLSKAKSRPEVLNALYAAAWQAETK